MEPEYFLFIVFIIVLIYFKIKSNNYQFAKSGRIAMSVMLIITGIAHFIWTKGMVMLMPNFMPFKVTLVYFTGVLEIIFAITFLIPKYQNKTSWFLVAFFVLLLPANIHGAIYKVNIETADYNGYGIAYLWYRIPLQLLFIVIVCYCGILDKKIKLQ